MTTHNTPRLCFIGFGEAGQAIATGLRDTGIETRRRLGHPVSRRRGREAQAGRRDMGARVASSAADAAQSADIIISAVTAASSLEAARSVAPHLTGNPYFLDINSVSPGRKKETERLLGDKARYVDVAILAPIHPARHQTPLLLAGPHARSRHAALDRRAGHARRRSPATRSARPPALKMIRSVMIKGIEALTLECFLAA